MPLGTRTVRGPGTEDRQYLSEPACGPGGGWAGGSTSHTPRRRSLLGGPVSGVSLGGGGRGVQVGGGRREENIISLSDVS